jgi:hypothetical protein
MCWEPNHRRCRRFGLWEIEQKVSGEDRQLAAVAQGVPPAATQDRYEILLREVKLVG